VEFVAPDLVSTHAEYEDGYVAPVEIEDIESAREHGKDLPDVSEEINEA